MSACRKRALVDPFFLVDQHAVHDRDLAGGTAEIDAAELEPEPEGFAEAGPRLAVACREFIGMPLPCSSLDAQQTQTIAGGNGSLFFIGKLRTLHRLRQRAANRHACDGEVTACDDVLRTKQVDARAYDAG